MLTLRMHYNVLYVVGTVRAKAWICSLNSLSNIRSIGIIGQHKTYLHFCKYSTSCEAGGGFRSEMYIPGHCIIF